MYQHLIQPWKHWNALGQMGIYRVCSQYGIYVIPTEELIEELCNIIHDGEEAIECFCGLGIIGRELGMICTDGKISRRILV